MFPRIKRVWHPEQFHYHHRLSRENRRSVFEGWYFKIVDQAEQHPRAIIPGVFLGADSHAFIQVLDGTRGTGHYVRFDLRDFQAATDAFDVRIAGNHFHESGMTLNIDSEIFQVRGRVEFGPFHKWPVRFFSPGAMGPYALTPFMQCYHGMLSMRHELAGELSFNDQPPIDYSGGLGYCEKDWGRSFPAGYIWMQSLHFDTPGVTSISASAARIPWLTGGFRGFLAGFLHDNRLYRFTTYTGAKIKKLSVTDEEIILEIADRDHALHVRAWRAEHGGILHAPYEGQMLERVAEAMTARVHVELLAIQSGNVVFSGEGRMACLEAVNAQAVL